MKLDLRKIGINGKNVYIVGTIHIPWVATAQDRATIANFIKVKNLTSKNTVTLSEGDGYISIMGFVLANTVPEKFPVMRSIPVDTLTTGYLHKHLHKKFADRREKAIGDKLKTLDLIRREHSFRDFLYATALKQITLVSPKNVVLFVGSAHSPGVHGFLTDEKKYARYEQHILKLAPRAARKYSKFKQYLERQKRGIKRRNAKR